MWNLLKQTDCSRFREVLENAPNRSDLTADAEKHLGHCVDCQLEADEFYSSRAMLKALPSQRYEPSAWFPNRVMSAIAARERELKRSLETWTIVPRLASRLTWVSALALLLAGTWLYEQPRSTPPRQTETAGENLFETAPTSATPDDLLVSVTEADQ